ncbi:PP2C family serine/threonine-protein phosphatase [Parapedobacter pyrenivorans]|uniref:PP2C family serine/threonine-protein phosphatase n=1 Tax=Parapedobacter pyrenivorans TaxID=1305674 RepID=UPI003342B38B
MATITDSGCACTLGVHIATDRGNVRTNNEDRAAVVYPQSEQMQRERGVLLVLADGMGGYNSGEVASAMAVDGVAQVFFDGLGSIPDRLKEAFRVTNSAISWAGQAEANKGMGTTCTAVLVLGTDLYVAHVGDSRAYCLNDGQLTPLTTDQTYVQYLVRSGTIGFDEAMKHPKRNLLMQALGVSETVTPEIAQKQRFLAPGNVIMLCSDGLYEYLADEEIAAYLRDEAVLDRVAQEMVDEAKRRGGHDNITVLLARVGPYGHTSGLKVTTEMHPDRISK